MICYISWMEIVEKVGSDVVRHGVLVSYMLL